MFVRILKKNRGIQIVYYRPNLYVFPDINFSVSMVQLSVKLIFEMQAYFIVTVMFSK